MTLAGTPGTRLRLGILFAIPVAFSLLFFGVNTVSEHYDATLLHLETLSSSIAAFRSVANDAEVGEHGFLLTGDERYLLTLDAANTRLRLHSDGPLRSVEDPAIQQRATHLMYLVRQRVEEANRVLDVQRNSGFVAALQIAKSGHSQEIMQQIRSLADSLQTELHHQISRDLDRDRLLTHITFLFFLFGTLVMLIVLVWLYNSLIDYMHARDAAHSQLRELNAELERKVEERTRELQQFNEELQQFAYVASHDLQEPLRTITSFTQLLASRYKGRLDEDADEFIGYIVNSARRMSDLINGLLALVRLRKAGRPVAPVPFDKLLDEAEISLQAAIRESNAHIERTPLPALVVDAVQFTQVLQNLIANAIKYRRDVPPVIRISAKRDVSDWIFSIADNGRGFDQEFAERIFGLFQRLHPREVEGTGMGLTIARKIVERHGGRIWAESQIGVGSTFYFSLPVSLEGRTAEESEATENAAGHPLINSSQPSAVSPQLSPLR